MKILVFNAIWCPSCLVMRPFFKKLQKEYNFELEEIDYDTSNEIKKWDIGDILPVAIILKNNQEIKRIIGEKSKKQLEKIIGDIYEA